MSLSLASLGRELDNVRRARRLSDSDTTSSASVSVSTSEPTSESAPSHNPARTTAPPPPTESRPQTMPTSQAAQAQADQPYPLCLLCFTRTPSAVLLPCCHLNLCYLCAPLLVHNATREREARAARLERERERARELDLASLATESDTASLPSPSSSPSTSPRVPWNVTLSRAVAKHPPSRRLSMGGYVAPKEGRRGGEIRGCDLLGTSPDDLGVTRAREADGRVRLTLEGEAAASCLVCRQGVSGWLRVYTG